MLYLACALLSAFVLIHDAVLADTQSEPQRLNPMLSDKYALWIGGFFPNIESSIKLDSKLGNPGDNIELENVFGLEDSKNVLWGGFRWRISRRNQLEMEFNNLNRSATKELETDHIDIGDRTIQAGARIDSTFDFTLARLTYGFAAFQRDKHELAVKGGFHIASTHVGIQAEGDIRDVDTGQTVCNPSPCQAEIESDSFTVPLPHLGLSYTYAITPTVGLRAQVLGFAVKINDIKGTLTELDLDIHYQPWKFFGLGGGFRSFKLTVKDKSDSFINGEFEYKYWGPAIYFLGSF